MIMLNQQQKDLLIGTLLGDGHFNSTTKGRPASGRYCAIQKKEHEQYLFYKYNILKPFCKSAPVYAEIFDNRTKKTYQRWTFSTITAKAPFNDFANLFYTYDTKSKRMVKDVPKNIKLFLTPAATAFWYMDDGALKWLGRSNAMRICTESFSEGRFGFYRLKSALSELYNIETQLVRKTNQGLFVGYRLAINEKNSAPFCELIKPYLVDCMRYRVSNGEKGHLGAERTLS